MPETKPKVIHLLHHLPLPAHLASTREALKSRIGGEYLTINKDPFWIGFWEDLHVKTAKETLKRSADFSIECWRPYGNGIDQIYDLKVDGVVHRVFPCRKLSIPYLGTWLWSKEIYKEIIKERNKQEIILHIHDGHSRFISLLLLKLKRFHIPTIYQHRSNQFAIFHYREKKGFHRLNIFLLFVFMLQKKALGAISLYLTDSRYEAIFLKRVLRFDRVHYFKQGIDFAYFLPDRDKTEVRKELDLPIDDKIILYVGRFYHDKDVDKLIHAFLRIKNEMPNVSLLLVGGYKSDEFFKMGKQAGAIMRERVPESELKDYYIAADVYVMPTFNKTVIHFGGFGNAPIQALACNLPVISKNIIHFPGSQEESEQIGAMYANEEDLATQIKVMLRPGKERRNCREVAIKYYDLDVSIRKLVAFYHSLIAEDSK